MDRISGANYTTVNGDRMWQDRNQTTGQQGTFGNAAWFNGVQEELMTIIAAGSVTPNAESTNQVLQAISNLFGGGGSVAYPGWQRLPGGLIIQWMHAVVPTGASNEPFALPTTFPNTFFNAFISLGSELPAGASAVGADPIGLGQVKLSNTEAAGSAQGCHVFALGN